MSEFGFVICSQNNNFAQVTENWIRKFFPNDTAIFILVNQSSIFEAYNKGIELTKNCKYVCFCHEDLDVVSVDVNHLKSLLNQDKIGFVGLAGAIKLPESGAWWEGYTGYPLPNLSGAAGHEQIKNNQLYRWKCTYGGFGQVEVLDGLMMFCNRSLLDVINWDSEYFNGWDFYDISITYQASRLGYKNITFSNIELYHWGLGNPRDSWVENRDKFLKWKDKLITP